jgi:protein-S-isoprenylcysteine O-methyltransferase Ste14
VRQPSNWEIIRPVLRLWGFFAVVHSLLASRQAKDAVRRLAGDRVRDGVYRTAFTTHSGFWALWLLWRTWRLPDRVLVQVPPPWSWLMRAGQGACVALAFAAGWLIGIPQFNGWPQLAAFLRGQTPAPEPGAQGPPLDRDGEMRVAGPYRITRHPANLALLLFLLFPKITVRGLTVGLIAAIYMILGSIHEEVRLRARYGAAYARYQGRAPFLLPGLPSWAPPTAARRDAAPVSAQAARAQEAQAEHAGHEVPGAATAAPPPMP